jgi:protein-S-isoprenylcysteine O-methyltransferase Ste14
MKTRLKINGIIIFLVVLFIALFSNRFLRLQKSSLVDTVASIFGIASMLCGQLLRTSGRGFKSENSNKGFALAQGGPYTLVRNPMYLGILLIGLGIISILFQWWVAVVFIILFLLRYVSLIFEEEKKLSGAFSNEYREYLKRVPRLFPSIAMLAKADLLNCLPLKKPWIKKEAGTILAVLLTTLFAKLWVDSVNNSLLICIAKLLAMSIMVILFLFLARHLVNRPTIREKDVSN